KADGASCAKEVDASRVSSRGRRDRGGRTEESDPAKASFESAKDVSQVDRTDPNAKWLSFNFQFAPWKLVLERFAKEAGLTLDMGDAPPPGTFQYSDDGVYSPTEALDI